MTGAGVETRVSGADSRSRAIARFASAVAAATTADDVLSATLTAMPDVGADGAALGIVEDDALALTALIGVRLSGLAAGGRVSLDTRLPGPIAIRERRTLALPSGTDIERTIDGASIVLESGDLHGLIAVPLLGSDHPLGALLFAFADDEGFDPEDVAYAELLAGIAAQALERARLAEAEQEARRAVQERDERLALALSAAAAGVWEMDVTSGTIDWSEAVLRLHGLEGSRPPRGLDGYLGLVHPEDRERVRAAFRRAIEISGAYDEEFRILWPDGTVRWTNGAARVFTDDAGRPTRIVGIARDVTDRRIAEAERNRLVEEEREANQLRDAFIGVISHELRTPITTIYGGARILGRDSLKPEQRAEVLDGILGESERLRRLVEDLLVLSRAERRRLEVADDPVLIGHLVRRVVSDEASRWPDRRFVTEVPPNLPAASGEETYVEQVLRNVVSNAAKYSPPGSTVRIAATRIGDEIVVSVSDEGPGVDEDDVDRVFDLFYRSPVTATQATGAGIGLFVTRRLVEAMGGRVTVEANEGRGATFSFALPIHDEWRTLGDA